jgi:hypothetical protein
MPQGRDQAGGFAELFGSLADGLGTLVSQHIQLARLELSAEARALGGQVARLLAFAPFVLIGYLFLCAALASWLSRWLGWSGSLLLIGAVNVLGGGVGIALALRALSRRKGLGRSVEELKQTASVLTRVADLPAPNPPSSLEGARGR